MTSVGVIPRGMWICTPENEMLAQPGIRVDLMMSHEAYKDAFEWADRKFHHDLRCAMWHSHKDGCNSHWIFARKDQAMLFKLTWAGK